MFGLFNKMASVKKSYYWREFLIIFCGSLGAFLLCSFYSYNPSDPTWFYQTTGAAKITNYCGMVGAHGAALFFYLFGSASFIFVFTLFFIVYLLMIKRPYRQEWDRLFAFGVLTLVMATIHAVYSVDFWATPYPGGYIGNALGSKLYSWFDMIGTFIFLHMLVLMCLIVLLRFSFVQVINKILYACSFPWLTRQVSKPCKIGMQKILSMLAPIGKRISRCMHAIKTRYFSAHDESHEFEGGIIDQELLEQLQKDVAQWQKEREQSPDAQDTTTTTAYTQKDAVDYNHAEQAVTSSSNPYTLPDLNIFIANDDESSDAALMQELEKRATLLQEKLERFGVYGKVISIKRGPVVTMFEYQPQMDTKISKITALEDDLAMVLQAMSIRIIAPIPGRSVVGFEVANKQRRGVLLATLVKSEIYATTHAGLPMILGVDTIGNPVIGDLARMPHLLMAGSTGSGKSVALNAMLISLLCKCSPDDLKLILIDPKRLEFAPYADIGHLLFPIVTDPKQSPPILRYVVEQMESRYEIMAQVGARNIQDYRAWALKNSQQPLPYIVLIIDELSDLMMTAGREIEDLIIRLTQMARAAGIHLIAATQRPSVDVITGLIKVNFPSRISFKVSSKVDSRTILDCVGAEKLLGKGDMLFLDASDAALKRLHGPYVLDKEIAQIVQHIRAQRPPSYQDLKQICSDYSADNEVADAMYQTICDFLKEVDEVSISLLQRRFRIGYNRSARIIDMLESQGLISPSYGGKTRKVIR